MSVYRDVSQAIACAMSIEALDNTAAQAWQHKYQAGFPEARPAGLGLSPEEQKAQHSMTRAILHKHLSPAEWHALVAWKSINDREVLDAVRWLVARIESPAGRLFVTKAVTAWAVPKRLPKDFYVLHSWDADGRPDGTLRRWRAEINKALDHKRNAAIKQAGYVLDMFGLLKREAG